MIQFPLKPITRTAHGRHAVRPMLTTAQVKQKAEHLLSRGLTNHAWRAIDTLAVSGVMSVRQLARIGVRLRTLQKYTSQYLLDRIPLSSTRLAEVFGEWKLPFNEEDPKDTLLYSLGPVGRQITKTRHDCEALPSYLARRVSYLMRMVVVNEIMLNLFDFWQESGWQATWVGMAETPLFGEAHPDMEPDAMLHLKKGKTIRHFLLVLHLDDSLDAPWRQVSRYESLHLKGDWQEHGVGETFPPLLIACKHTAIAEQYQVAVTHGSVAPRCTYYGKRLDGILDGTANLAKWYNFNHKRKDAILDV